MDNFAAIDFETANNERTSIFSVGVVIVRNGEIADRFYSLVHPEPEDVYKRQVICCLLWMQQMGWRLLIVIIYKGADRH